MKEVDPTITITNTSNINSSLLEYAPVIYQNGLVYISQYKNGPIDKFTGETRHEIFFAECDPNGTPMKPRLFSLEIYSQYNEGPVSFNTEGNKVFFTRNNIKNGVLQEGKDGQYVMKIYEAEKGYFDWENIKELPFNSDNFSCMHPSITYTGDRIYFSSNMPGKGQGGMDIYFVQKINGMWSDPINMGPEVNTEKNEVFPFIHNSGILFFTSDGHRVYGGLDLFMIDVSTNIWGDVQNLGKPFNSEFDDLSMVLDAEGDMGYFASSRSGGKGKDDIYMFKAPEGIRGRILIKSVNTFISVIDEASRKPVSGANIRLFERSSDGLVKNQDLYDLELVPSANHNQLVFNLVKKDEADIDVPFFKTDAGGEALVRFVEGRGYMLLVSKSGYQSKEVVILPENLDEPIEIEISQNNCLELEGLVLDNQTHTPIPRASVRIESNCGLEAINLVSNMDGVFQYCLPIGCKFDLFTQKEGYSEGNSTVVTENLRGRRTVSSEILMEPNASAGEGFRQPFKEGSVIVLENVYYDVGKPEVQSNSIRDLETLAGLMLRYPTMEIELGAHTDSRGEASTNLQLSLKRAESAKEFLVSKGINEKRIIAIGYGESKPRNRCEDGVNCSEEEHQYNRRTEILIRRINEPIIGSKG